MPAFPLKLYSVFHLNLAYSSIEEDQRKQVMDRCYWPLLHLIQELSVPLGIEASGYTLETIVSLDKTWLDEFRRLLAESRCEFIGSGYMQLIGPLVPADVNVANLRIGNKVYKDLLGLYPKIALVNEQAYSAGLIAHYLNAGYEAIIMEWENPARFHPEWDLEMQYLPQIACGQHGEEISLIWNRSVSFQKFQRYVHREIGLNDYLDFLRSHTGDRCRYFSLYGSDAEIFDFRPGRFATENLLPADGKEWGRIKELFRILSFSDIFQIVFPSDVLKAIGEAGAGNRIHLETAQEPIPVKKQEKYNVTRWAVTNGSININTACWRLYQALKRNPEADEDDWRELCYLWGSDFRTHLTERRWQRYRERLQSFGERIRMSYSPSTKGIPRPSLWMKSGWQSHNGFRLERKPRFLVVENDCVRASLNCQRGLAIESLEYKKVSQHPLVGTLAHGYFNDVAYAADYYSGHLIMEIPGMPKVTDLNPVEPQIQQNDSSLIIRAKILTPLGFINKSIHIAGEGCLKLCYYLDWNNLPAGSLRLGFITLNPSAFDFSGLYFETNNGGSLPERFSINGKQIEHGRCVSFLVSASTALGLTEGRIAIGDSCQRFTVEVDQSEACIVGMVTFLRINPSYFCRIGFSVSEFDDTISNRTGQEFPRRFEFVWQASLSGDTACV